MVILDLECNRGYDNTPLGEILQIGAVRVDYLGGPVTDTLEDAIVTHRQRSRDNGRTPMQWDGSPFTSGTPWPPLLPQQFRCGIFT